MGEFDSMLKISIGPSSFQLGDYSFGSDPQLDSEGQEVGRAITIDATGWIVGTSASDFAGKVLAARGQLEVRGVNVVITGMGGHKEVEVLAARCLGGTPHVSIKFLPQADQSALRKAVSITVKASAMPAEATGEEGEVREVKKKVSKVDRVDELESWRYEGEARGPNTEAWWTRYQNTLRTVIFPWPNWTIGFEREFNEAGDTVRYVVLAEELAEAIPLAPAGGAVVVDGTIGVRFERDERLRRLIVRSYNLVVKGGDPLALLPQIRPARAYRESVEKTGLRERRLIATFTELDSAEMDDLVGWDASVEFQQEAATVRAVQYEGIAAMLIWNQAATCRVLQSGRAVGLGKFPRPPELIYPLGYHLEQAPSIRMTQVSSQEYETAWQYEMVGTRLIGQSEVLGLMMAALRPAKPAFY